MLLTASREDLNLCINYFSSKNIIRNIWKSGKIGLVNLEKSRKFIQGKMGNPAQGSFEKLSAFWIGKRRNLLKFHRSPCSLEGGAPHLGAVHLHNVFRSPE